MLAFRSVGILYLLSGLWCALKPELAAGFLGLEFSHVAGKAEFFSVYGGLQVGIAIAILACSLIPTYQLGASFFAFLVSFGLFGFRLLSVISIDQSSVLIYMLFFEGFLAFLLFMVWRKQVGIKKHLQSSNTKLAS
ncbi:MAG: hypothetical protein ACI84K_000096 [Pseudohongiellaceae bacterium]|jgi:hypothetical protein